MSAYDAAPRNLLAIKTKLSLDSEKVRTNFLDIEKLIAAVFGFQIPVSRNASNKTSQTSHEVL